MVDRRDIMRSAAIALLVPAIGGLPLIAQARGRSFAPPAEPMVYTRRFDRELVGGARFATTRKFAVRFLPTEGGFLVEGEQIDVAVDAPAHLARFAELERSRVERALFPIRLDHAGLIVPRTSYARPVHLDEAVKAVLARIETMPLAETAEAEAEAFVSSMHAKSEAMISELPSDLFAPAGGRSSASREFALPGGENGQLSVLFMAEASPATGVMRHATREVVTRVADTSRRTAEEWTLALRG